MIKIQTETQGIPDAQLLTLELSALDVNENEDRSFSMIFGTKDVLCRDLVECLRESQEETTALKQQLRGLWKRLDRLACQIMDEPEHNDEGCVANILFLSSVKKVHLLSMVFDELKETTGIIEKIFNIDISHVNKDFVICFNELALAVKLLHVLVMKEIYRSKVIRQNLRLIKGASIAGPWSNLDLPMLERQWLWNEPGGDEEYMRDRTRAKQKQTRYNPEYNFFGIYYSWEDLRRNPYRVGDEEESPYPQRRQLSIP